MTVAQAGVPVVDASPFSFTADLFFAPLGIIGFILFLVAMHGFAKDYQDDRIFNYVLYGFLASIVIAILASTIVFYFFLSSIGSILFPTTPPNSTEFLNSFLENFLPYFLIVPLVGLIPAFFNMFAFNKLSNKSEVRLFRTVGLLGVVASAVTIAFWFVGVALFYAGYLSINSIFLMSVAGSAVSLAAWILGAKAFLSIPVPTSQPISALPAKTQTSPSGQVKYCAYCGAANSVDAEFCVQCGRKQ
jgi:uncharacterized membrane protein